MRARVGVLLFLLLGFLAGVAWLSFGSASRPPPGGPPRAAQAADPQAASPSAEPLPFGEPSAARPSPEDASEGPGQVEVVALVRGAGPLAGVDVELWRRGADAAAGAARTGDDGRARFEEVAPGRWRVLASNGLSWSFTLAGGELRVIRLVAEPELSLRVLVIAFDGAPVEGAEVRVESRSLVRTDHRGRARVVARPDEVLSARSGDATAQRLVDDAVFAARFVVLRLGPPAGAASAALAGQVLDELGAPTGLATVTARSGHGFSFRALSDETGRFELAVAPDRRYRVTARSVEGREATAEGVRAGRSDLVLQLDGGAALEGVVLRDDGGPASTFTLRWRSERGALRARPFSQPEGRFRLEGLRAAAYRVEAEAGALGRAEARVELPDGGTGRVELRLQPLGRIEGVVVAADTGRPLPSARVRLESRPGLGLDAPSTQTDAAGRFVLEGVPPGRRSVSAAQDGFRSRIVAGVVVPSDGAATPVEIALSASDGDGGLELVGIGAVLSVSSGALVIERAVPGGGAAEAGLAAGARILAVDGTAVEELGFDGAIQAIRGREGTTVQLTVDTGDGDARLMTLLRRKVST